MGDLTKNSSQLGTTAKIAVFLFSLVTSLVYAGDLSEIQSSETVKVVGSSSTGAEQTPVQSTSNGALHSNLRNNAGTEIGTTANPVRIDPTGTTPQPVSLKGGSDIEAFGAQVSLPRQSQVKANFSNSLSANNTTATVSGGGSTALANATVTIASGTGTTATAKLQSNETTVYSPDREMYAQFTAAFTTPTSANSNQRAGLFDANNGVFIGYQGTTFGVTTRAAGVDTFVSAFNADLLTGAVGSSFIRLGVPEAIDYTKKNVYRIRFGWLGAAPLYFEVMAPDGKWVNFHTIHLPNTSTLPAIQATDLPITMEVTKASVGATDVKILTTSWDAGVVDIVDTDNNGVGTITSGSAPTNALVVNTSGRGTLILNITGTWVATLVTEGNVGDGNWVDVPSLSLQGAKASPITANMTAVISPAGFTSLRLRASSYISGTVNISWNQSRANGNLVLVAGNVPSGTADVGNPIKIGGVYNATLPIYSDGQRTEIQTDLNGRIVTSAITGFGAAFTFGDVVSASTALKAVRRTTYNEQTTNAQRSFSSSDVDDDGSPADTGARKLHITYLDSTGAGPFDEVITLNGTTCVATVATNIAFVEHIEITTVGSTGSNEGTLTMFVDSSCGSGTIGTIEANSRQSFWAHHYVPTGKIANVTGISAGHNGTTVGSGAVFVLKAKNLTVADSVEDQVSDFVRLYGQSSTFSRNYASPIKVTGPSRLVLYVIPESASTFTYRAAIDYFEP